MLKKKVTQWNAWREASTNRQIFSAMLVVAVMTLLVKLIAAVKEIVVAGYFGTGEVVDAFLIAFVLPTFFIIVLAGSFSSAMMPTYIRIRDNTGMVKARQLFSSVMVLAILFMLTTTLVLAILAPFILPLLGSGFSAQSMELALSLFYWLLPVLAFTGMSRIYAIAINAGERFIVVAFAPVITPVSTIFFLVLLVDQWGIYALTVGVVFGAVIELLILARVATGRGLPLLPRWSGMTDELRIVMSQYGPMVTGAFLMSGTVLVDQAMAAMLESGSVATLNYANKVVAMILGIGSMALGTAVLPHFSRMVAEKNWVGVRHTFRTYTQLIIFISVPITAALFLFSESIIGILFERGAFSAEDTHLVGQVQAFYLLQIPFYLLGILIVRLISSLKGNHILMWSAAISLPLNIQLNYVFMQNMGVSGIALSTSAVYFSAFVFLLFNLKISIKRLESEVHE